MQAGKLKRARYLGSQAEIVEMWQRWGRECLDQVITKRENLLDPQKQAQQDGKGDATDDEPWPSWKDSDDENISQLLQAMIETGRKSLERARVLGPQLINPGLSATQALEKVKPVAGMWVPGPKLIAGR